MAEQSGDEYLESLKNSKDESDRKLAQAIIKGQQTSVAESPLDKVIDLTPVIVDKTPPSTAKKPKNLSS